VVPSIAAGQVQVLNIAATDADGIALQNVPVTVNVTGVNGQSRQLTTDGSGQTIFAYPGNSLLTGTDQIQATATVNGTAAYSNTVVVSWNSGTNQAPLVSAGSPQTVTLPSAAILNGSVSDDGLPSNTVAITWSMQSGPGPVTFDNPNQAVTAANFPAQVTYVLQLSASDGLLTSNSTVTITVNGGAGWTGGWFASPLDGSTITTPVPITLISGITLTSGTLSIYPAANQTAITVLNASTTGTGQIGNLDPTTLKDGSYFVELRATNSQGDAGQSGAGARGGRLQAGPCDGDSYGSGSSGAGVADSDPAHV